VFDLSMDDFDDNDVLLDWEMYAGAVLQACSATGVSNHPLCPHLAAAGAPWVASLSPGFPGAPRTACMFSATSRRDPFRLAGSAGQGCGATSAAAGTSLGWPSCCRAARGCRRSGGWGTRAASAARSSPLPRPAA